MKVEKVEVENLKKQVQDMGMRITTLVDEVRTLQQDISHFKSQVGKDITTLENLARRIN